ncbi:hypothetical protein [Candidatus Hodarchaeum mangrovi]
MVTIAMIDQMKDQIGLIHIYMLKRIGVDVDQSVMTFLRNGGDFQEIIPDSTMINPPDFFPDEIMTSELVYRAQSINDKYGLEFKRRLSLLQFLPSRISQLFYTEKVILSSSNISDRDLIPWYQRVPSKHYTIVSLPPYHALALSELILMGYESDHLLYPSPEMKRSLNYKNIFWDHLNDRLRKLGWTEGQSNFFMTYEHRIYESYQLHNSLANPIWQL